MIKGVLGMVVLPIWFDWLWAPGIFLALPALGLLDFLALGGILAAMHVENPWKRSRRVFFQVWICGFFADLAGAVFLLVLNACLHASDTLWSDLAIWRMLQTEEVRAFDSGISFLFVALAVLLSGVLIYFFHKMGVNDRLELPYEKQRPCALAFAALTAPYFFFF